MSSNLSPGVRRRGVPRAARLALGVALVAGIVGPDLLPQRHARGQDDFDAQPAVNQPAVGRAMAVPVQQIPDIDQWVFGGKSRKQTEESLDSLLSLRLEAVDHAAGLSDAQKKKLKLAGHGEMKRFFLVVDELKAKYSSAEFNQEKVNQIAQEIQPLQTRVNAGFFGADSLFCKILKHTLDGEQAARYEKDERARRKFTYEAKVALVVSMLESGLPLDDEQRRKLVQVILDETDPPKTFGRYDYYVVLYQVGKVDEEKLRPIFDDDQWQALRRTIAQAKGMEAMLRKNGLLP